MEKYSKLLNTSYQKEMIFDIEKDLKKYYKEMNENELQVMSNEIYVVCTLMYHKIDLLKIIQFLQFLDNTYFEKVKGDGLMIECAITDKNAIHLKTIVNKYIKEIEKKQKL